MFTEALGRLDDAGRAGEDRSNAAAKGLSVSAYLWTLGLGYEPRPVFDAQNVMLC